MKRITLAIIALLLAALAALPLAANAKSRAMGQFLEALSEHDVNSAMGALTETSVISLSLDLLPPDSKFRQAGTENHGATFAFTDKEKIQAALTDLFSPRNALSYGESRNSGMSVESENKFAWRAIISTDELRRMGFVSVDTLKAICELILEPGVDGKVKSFSITLTPESLARLQAVYAQAGSQAPGAEAERTQASGSKTMPRSSGAQLLFASEAQPASDSGPRLLPATGSAAGQDYAWLLALSVSVFLVASGLWALGRRLRQTR